VRTDRTGEIGRVEREATLLARIARRDEAALEELYRLTSPRVLGLAMKILRDSGAAEETMLDVYAQVWGAAGTFELERGRPMTWILALTRNRALDRLRSQARVEERTTFDLDDEPVDQHPRPDETLSWNERSRVVRRALGELEKVPRALIAAAFFGGLTHREIAARFDLPLGTVKTKIRRGLLHLRGKLVAPEEAT
jgi:RNA polymerase sigma-70 factor (ECF subfamily)